MSCPVCQSSGTFPALTGTDCLFESTTKSFNLDACQICRCLFLNPMPAAEEIAGFYPNEYWWNASRSGLLKKIESLYRRVVLRDHVGFIVRAASSCGGSELLDVGCGSGTLLGLMKQRGFRSTGVDLSAEAARIAANENGVRVIVGTLAQAGFPAHSFDIVTLFHVMEHVADPRQVLAEVSRILKDDGTLVLQVPNIDSWQFKLFGAGWYGLDIPRHLIDYSKDSIVRLLKSAGFFPKRIKHFNLRDNAPALVSSMFPSLDPISRAVRQRRHHLSEPPLVAWMRHLAYLALVVCAYPFACLESAFQRGATLMIEARRH